MTDNFYNALSITNAVNLPTWLQALSQSLPELLLMLVHQNQPPSFERMQLINMELLVVGTTDTTGNLLWSSQELIKKPDQVLSLGGVLHSNGQPLLKVTISYFLRGQRRFFKHPAPPLLGNQKHLSPIAADEINEFFQALNQTNDFFTDKNLAHLVGCARPLVPTHMATALLLSQALLNTPTLKKFSLSFYQAIPQEEPLVLTQDHDGDFYSFGLGTAEDMGIVLVAA